MGEVSKRAGTFFEVVFEEAVQSRGRKYLPSPDSDRDWARRG